jgi:hypothetical protein
VTIPNADWQSVVGREIDSVVVSNAGAGAQATVHLVFTDGMRFVPARRLTR